MGKLVVSAFLSLDGVMQAPGGPEEDRDGGFRYGGWLFPFGEKMGDIVAASGEADPARGPEAIARADAFLLGRRTYEIFAGFWPGVTDPTQPDYSIGVDLNSKPKYVASRTLDSVEWNNSTLLRGDVVDAVKSLKSEIDGEILTQGSSNLIQTLIKNDLVDEYLLWFFPVALGQGKRLFGEGTLPTRFKLAGSATTAAGGLINSYLVDGRPEVGSFAQE